MLYETAQATHLPKSKYSHIVGKYKVLPIRQRRMKYVTKYDLCTHIIPTQAKIHPTMKMLWTEYKATKLFPRAPTFF